MCYYMCNGNLSMERTRSANSTAQINGNNSVVFFIILFFILMTEVWPLCIYLRIKEQRERPANAGRSQMTATASASFIR